MAADDRSSRKAALWELARLYLRLGTTAFGGPAAHIAMMEEEVVRRRGWLTRDKFLDLLGAANLIPGPSSTEMSIYIGYRRAGWPGLIVAGVCFIVPAALLTLLLAYAYVRLGGLPQAGAVLYGVKPVIIAVVAQALLSLAPAALKSPMLMLIAAVAAVASLLGVSPLAVIVPAGIAAALKRAGSDPRRTLPWLATAVPAGVAAAAPFSLSALFLVFLKIGSVLFGSGYVLLAFLRSDLVDARGWLTEAQLLDAVAAGQVTPGPVFTTATFIGYLLAGLPGAAVATVAIFLPSFVFVAFSGPLIPRLRGSPMAGAFLDGVNAASLALMAVVTWQLGRAAIVDWPSAALALSAGVLLIRFRVNSVWIVLGGGLLGVALKWLL
jgi:chromate transporter